MSGPARELDPPDAHPAARIENSRAQLLAVLCRNRVSRLHERVGDCYRRGFRKSTPLVHCGAAIWTRDMAMSDASGWRLRGHGYSRWRFQCFTPDLHATYQFQRMGCRPRFVRGRRPFRVPAIRGPTAAMAADPLVSLRPEHGPRHPAFPIDKGV